MLLETETALVLLSFVLMDNEVCPFLCRQALREAAPLTAQSRTELLNIGWAVAWGWLPMTLAGLLLKTVPTP